jgi:hypothetical protein
VHQTLQDQPSIEKHYTFYIDIELLNKSDPPKV